jgi:hypothetical protein
MPTSIARALLLARLIESRELIHHHVFSIETLHGREECTMLKGDELCDNAYHIPIVRNHAYTAVQIATSSGAEYPSDAVRCVTLISAQENICEVLEDAA